ncbi:hypothetical protein JVU11DRAFT_1321 [Chiua virens]|nr:hypothetical protein JVU11DRAFT_1321 [Chiua virens]
MSLKSLLPLAFLVAAVRAVFQGPFIRHDVTSKGSFDLVIPMNFSVLSQESFTTLSHPRFPNHAVRIKNQPFATRLYRDSYTGYLNVDQGAKHLFFYFFESRRDPARDDVMMWINGGLVSHSI